MVHCFRPVEVTLVQPSIHNIQTFLSWYWWSFLYIYKNMGKQLKSSVHSRNVWMMHTGIFQHVSGQVVESPHILIQFYCLCNQSMKLMIIQIHLSLSMITILCHLLSTRDCHVCYTVPTSGGRCSSVQAHYRKLIGKTSPQIIHLLHPNLCLICLGHPI